jgi:hypothetical protein
MAQHKPGSIWSLRKNSGCGYVRTADAELLQIVLPQPGGHDLNTARPQIVLIDRKDARLLAKRINECLDGTRSKS